MADTIFLRVGTEDRIPLKAFIDSLQNFLSVLRDLDATISHNPKGNTIWEVVSLQKNSPPVVGVAPRPKSPKLPDMSQIVEEQLLANAKSLSANSERNQYLSDSALASLERLAGRTPKLGPMAIYIDGTGKIKDEADITESTLKNVQQLTKVRYSAFGSLVGSLDAITVHNGNEFRVWDETTRKPVRCKFQEKELEHVKSLLKSRVRVSGVIQSNSAGSPIVIELEDLELLVKRELPTIEEMSGLVEDFTDGKSLKEYMEELSDE